MKDINPYLYHLIRDFLCLTCADGAAREDYPESTVPTLLFAVWPTVHLQVTGLSVDKEFVWRLACVMICPFFKSSLVFMCVCVHNCKETINTHHATSNVHAVVQ